MHRAHARYAEADTDSAIVARHGELIDRAARRISARTAGAVSADDLWSAGAMGLLDAARRFDPARDVRFETFAEHRIRGAMLDELRRMDHLPRRLRAQAEAVERMRATLTRSLQREPEAEELASATGLALDELASIVALAEPQQQHEDQLPASLPSPDEQLERQQLAGALSGAIGALPDRLQLVLSLHYVEGLTYREIAGILQVSEPRVCQLHSDAMHRLRSALPKR